MTLGSSTPLRDANVSRLRGYHDVVVIGAGINGAVTAAALAAGGAKVALVDREDFGGGTSQESSNLIWGGIKYLENFELGLVWELCASRNRLLRSYPANVREIRFFAPLGKGLRGFKRSVSILWAGTWIYWLMGRSFTRPPRLLTAARIAAIEPTVDAGLVKGGIEYSDAFLPDNDARFVFSFVRTALDHGASVANYVEVESSRWDTDGIWTTQARDRVSGEPVTLRSSVLVNAAGPHVDPLNESNGVRTETHHLFSKGIHLVVDRLTEKEHVLTFFDETDRMFFVIPMGDRSVVGTTDTRVERPETEVTDEDRDLVLHNVNRHLAPARELSRRDIIAERCGVRNLVLEDDGASGEEEWLHLSRKHVVEVEEEKRCISIFGGKLTDCLNVGEEVVEAAGRLGIALRDPTEDWFGEPPDNLRLHFLKEAAKLRLDQRPTQPSYEKLSDRLWRRYGTDAFGMLSAIGRDPSLAEAVSEGTQYRICEIEYAARNEMVVTLEDFLRRRSKIALLNRREILREAEGLRAGCRILFGEDADDRFREYFAER